MTLERPNFHILTGGPGAGKTTTLEALRRRGFACVDEAARQILKEQKAIGGDATHDGDQRKYRDLMLARSIEAYLAVEARTQSVFFDRAIPELRSYAEPPGAPPAAHVAEAIARYRYSPAVFLFPPWPEIYRHDAERKHTLEHAIAVCESIRAACLASGYDPIEVPRLGVEARADFILARAGAA